MLQPYPRPTDGEYPASYADRLGRWYARYVTDDQKKKQGQYLTPVQVARFMAKSLSMPTGRVIRVLDPGAGAGVLSCAFCEIVAEYSTRPMEVELTAYETDQHLADVLRVCLQHAEDWLVDRDVVLRTTVYTDDFILAHASSLEKTQLLLLDSKPHARGFDVAISNPPYFKLQKADPRAKAASAVVHGQPNIYALFMAVTASTLSNDGEMAFITPRSYAAGPYFRLFRETFFRKMKPLMVHLFHSRRAAFRKDDILQENVILVARRREGWYPICNGDTVRVSSSKGIGDLSGSRWRDLPLAEVLDLGSKDKVLRIPVTEKDTAVTNVVGEWRGNLGSYGLDISTGPVVPFRARSLLVRDENTGESHAPLLWMQSITPMRIQWPAKTRNKPQYMAVSKDSMPLLVADNNYVLVRRFSSKEQHRRLTAAPLLKGMLGAEHVGLENHLNYVYRRGGSLSKEEAYGLATLFNSTLLDTFFRIYNGNTQVSATELRAMPLPPIDAIREIGRRAMSVNDPASTVDEFVRAVLGLAHSQTDKE